MTCHSSSGRSTTWTFDSMTEKSNSSFSIGATIQTFHILTLDIINTSHVQHARTDSLPRQESPT